MINPPLPMVPMALSMALPMVTPMAIPKPNELLKDFIQGCELSILSMDDSKNSQQKMNDLIPLF